MIFAGKTAQNESWKLDTDCVDSVLLHQYLLASSVMPFSLWPAEIFSSAYGKKYIIYSMNGYMQTCFKFLRDLRMLWNLVG